MRVLLARVRGLVRQMRGVARVDAEMEAEFRFHIERRAEDLVRAGLTPAAAAKQARQEFGGTDAWREEGRRVRGLALFDEVRGEVRYTLRSLLRRPGFTAAAVLTLGVGVGVNASVFSLLSASLLRPLPFPAPDELVVVHQVHSPPGRAPVALRWSYPEYVALRESVSAFSGLAAYARNDVNIAGDAAGGSVRVGGELVSPSYFAVLGLQPALGRWFLPEEDDAGRARVAVLGHALWRRNFDADPAVIGREIRVQGLPFVVVGVAPAGFAGLSGEREVWLPEAIAPLVGYAEHLTTPQHFQSVIGRLRPGVSAEQAQAELAAAGTRAVAAARGAADGAAAGAAAGAGAEDAAATDVATAWSVDMTRLDAAQRDARTVRAHAVLSGAVLFVLLIAVANLTALMLARSVGRARELAIRAALGAGRARVVRHVVVEGTALGVLGGVVAALFAAASVRMLADLAPQRFTGVRHGGADLAAFAAPTVDWRVIAFALGAAVVAAIAAALVPALRATRANDTLSLRSGARGATAGVGTLQRPTLLSGVAVVQTASAVVLLAGAGMLLTGFQRLRVVDPGIVVDNIITARLSAPEREYADRAAVLLEDVLERVSALPGVAAATLAFCTPYERCSWTTMSVPGSDGTSTHGVGRHYVGPDHFRTLGVPLLRGRALSRDDREGRPRVAVINETAARTIWPGEDPIGQRVHFSSGGGFASPDSLTEIVGIVGDVLYAAPGRPVGADVYTSYLQFTWTSATLIVRSAGEPAALVPALRSAVASVDPDVPLYDVRTMHQRGRDALADERFATAVVGGFAVLGLLLAALGVYGVLAYSVSQRTREIGIRMALGSTGSAMMRLVMGQGVALVAAGLAAGLLAAVAMGRFLGALVIGVEGVDAVVYGGVAVVLLAVGVAATALPARAAAGVDPARTLGGD